MQLTGAPYPIEKHPRGYFHPQYGVDQLKSDLLILLLTNPGERVMMPDYGTPLRQLMFEPNDTIIQEEAREMIINAITTWEPRITVDQIEVVTSIDDLDGLDIADREQPDNGHILGIKITFFDPTNIKDVQVLSLEVPLSND